MSKRAKQIKPSRFVTAEEVCEELQICRRTLNRMILDGRFPPPLRLGLRRIVWLKVEYESHIEQARAQRTTTAS